MPEPQQATPIAREALEAAAFWYVQLQGDGDTPSAAQQAEQARITAAWQAWLQADDSHRLAWEKMCLLEQQLASVPAALARPALAPAASSKRQLAKLLGVVLVGGAGTLLWPELATGWRRVNADYRTATGERRKLRLPDGSELTMNTASALSVHFNGSERVLRLWQGELMVQVANSAAQALEIHTAQGVIRTGDGELTVLQAARTTRVALLTRSAQVALHKLAHPALALSAGQQTVLSANGIAAPTPIAAGEGAWREGKIIALERRLDDFLAQLARYRPGKIICAPEVAALRVSGAFRLADTDAVLHVLAASLPINIEYFTRYWVRVVARP